MKSIRLETSSFVNLWDKSGFTAGTAAVIATEGGLGKIWVSTSASPSTANSTLVGPGEVFNVTSGTTNLFVRGYGEFAVYTTSEYADTQVREYNVTAKANPLTGGSGVVYAGSKALIGQHVGRRMKSITDPIGYITQPAGNNTSSFGMAISIPGGYDSVQLGYTHAGGAGACTGFKALVAATDNVGDKLYAATADSRRFITPWRGGVEYNEISASGWNSVTWAGASSVDLADAGTGKVSVALSDVVPISGIADATYPTHAPILIRAYPGAGPFSRGSYSGIADAATYFPNAGANYVMGAVRAGDTITNPAVWTTANSASFGSTSILPVFVVAYAGTAPATIMLCGDSRFDGATEVSDTRGYESFAFLLQKYMLSRGQNVAVARAAQSGMESANYFQQGMSMLEKIKPSVAMYVSYTVNDGWPTADVLSAARQRTLQFIDRCQHLGVVPLIISAYPRTMESYPQFNGNLALVQAHDTWCANLGVPYFSPLKAYGDSTGAWANGIGYDTDHMTQAGYQRMSEDVAPLLSPFI